MQVAGHRSAMRIGRRVFNVTLQNLRSLRCSANKLLLRFNFGQRQAAIRLDPIHLDCVNVPKLAIFQPECVDVRIALFLASFSDQ
jgi:hypothetical protein